MSNGTTLNDVYVARLHKCNAEETRDECEDSLRYARETLLVLAAMTPTDTVDEIAWPFYIRREIDGIFESVREDAVRAWKAQYVIDFPEDCQDELVAADWISPKAACSCCGEPCACCESALAGAV